LLVHQKNHDFTSCEYVNSKLIYEENIQYNPNFTPVFQSVHKKEKIITYRRKLRQIKKLLWKKKKIIRKQKQERKQLHCRNEWESITADLNNSQRTFFKMIQQNLKRAPDVHFL